MPSKVAQLEIARHQRELILKPRAAHVFGAPMTTPVVLNITEGPSSQLAELPVGYYDFGLLDKEDAVNLSREMEKADINAIGYSNPVRSDITSDIFGMAFKGLETNRFNIETNLGVDLSGVTPDPVTGEVSFDQPAVALIRRQRYMLLADVGSGVDTIHFGRQFLAGEVSETGEQTITDGEGYLGWPFTVNAMVDTLYGVSVRHHFGGPGWKNLLEEAGFDPKATYVVTIGGNPTGGTFTLSFGGQTTDPIAFNATAAAVQAALEALSTLDAGDVTVTGTAGGPYTVKIDVAKVGTLTGSGASLTPSGTVTIS